MPHTRKKRGPAQPRLAKTRTFEPGELLVAHQGNRTKSIPAEMAVKLVDSRSAEWINDSTEIRVFRNTLELDASIELTLNFMEGVSEGDYFCMKIWKMRQRSRGLAA